MNRKARGIDTGLLGAGLVLLAVGTLMLLDRFTDLSFGNLVRDFWPMFLVVVAIPKLTSRRTVWNGLWLLTIGVWLQLVSLHVLGLTFRNSWPPGAIRN